MTPGIQLRNVGGDEDGVTFEARIEHASGWEIPVRVRVRIRQDDGVAAEVESIVCLGFNAAEFSDDTFGVLPGVEVSDGIDAQVRQLLAELAIDEWCRLEPEPDAVDERRLA